MGNFAARYYKSGQIFDHKSPGMFLKDPKSLKVFLGFLNSIVVAEILSVINPTISTGADTLRKIPVADFSDVSDEIMQMVDSCIAASKADWDSFEASWDFQVHPLLHYGVSVYSGLGNTKGGFSGLQSHYLHDTTNENDRWIEAKKPIAIRIETAYEGWRRKCDERFQLLKTNEEELNRIFINIYGLQDELTPEVEDRDVTVRRADLGRDIRSLISYAVGCMLGRYSLDAPGLAFAGGEWNPDANRTYPADTDGILPITDDEYFDDDIVSRFVEWVRTVYGADTLEENLKFIADALGGKGTPRDVIRQYFLSDFYKDHLKVYQKRPIYWLFDSGKKNGFKCLIYMHRYQPDTLARIRTDYLHELQGRYRNAIETLERQIAGATTSERVKLQKRLTALKVQAEEARVYEEKIHHLADQMIKIDLDDGVKHNYTIFKDVLAPIK